jgi:hypothetical protein
LRCPPVEEGALAPVSKPGELNASPTDGFETVASATSSTSTHSPVEEGAATHSPVEEGALASGFHLVGVEYGA